MLFYQLVLGWAMLYYPLWEEGVKKIAQHLIGKAPPPPSSLFEQSLTRVKIATYLFLTFSLDPLKRSTFF